MAWPIPCDTMSARSGRQGGVEDGAFASMLDPLARFFDFLWASFLLLAPMLLLGLFLAGLIHVLISREAILRWLSGNSLKAVCTSAAIGVPLPLCSCSVVPVVAEMRRKGASRPACMSFLITAPETGADSILVTHAFFGLVAAVVRPVVSFVTAIVTGILCIVLARDQIAVNAAADEAADATDCCDCSHDHEGHETLERHADDCYVSPARLKSIVMASLPRLPANRSDEGAAIEGVVGQPLESEVSVPVAAAQEAGESLSFGKIVKHVFRYGFVEVADDILFALLVGVCLGALLYLVVPDGMMSSDYARWISYPVMVLVGVPIYICASASTPIAAALVSKGLSPGAALIFLMTGPATNAGTVSVVVSQFGARFGSVYVGGVVAATAVLGIATDAVVLGAGLTLPVTLAASHAPAVEFVQWASAVCLIALMAWRFQQGALKSGFEDLVSNLRPASYRFGRG